MKRLALATTLFLLISLIAAGCAPTAATPQPTGEAAAGTAAPTAAPAIETPPEPIPCTIAFVTDRDGSREIYSMDSEGANLTNLTNFGSDEFDPVWSPDGKQIAFVSNRPTDSGGGQFVYVMNADGSGVRQLTSEPDSQFPDWSEDGSVIVYSANADIHLIKADGSAPSVNLTNSPEEDTQPVISADGRQIAWMSGATDQWNLFLMNTDGSNVRQLTDNGTVTDVVWTVDGRLFTHYKEPTGICFNCVMNADGSNVIDAGGKGSIQEFVPYWTLAGDRVELISGEMLTSDSEILLVSDIYPDIFKNISNNPARDTDPVWPANCGPVSGAAPVSNQTQPTETGQGDGEIVIGYTGERSEFEQADLTKACNEMGIECREGGDISELADQGVDAIVYFTNRWNVLGDSMKIGDAASRGIFLVVVNAESSDTYSSHVYNLSIDSDSTNTVLTWMFNEMGGSGEFVYFNTGGNETHQSFVDQALKAFPGIQATAMAAEYDGEALAEDKIRALVTEKPNLGAVWADEYKPNLFWAISKHEADHLPATVCEPSEKILRAWKGTIDSGSPFKCIAVVEPGEMGYESIIVAYYLASGYQINPEALTGIYGNSLRYEYPVITNENLADWLEKTDKLIITNGEAYKFPAMSAEEIKFIWFQN
jgi:TolB protein